MGILALLVHVGFGSEGEPRIRLAASLADSFGAALIGVAAGSYLTAPAGSELISAEQFDQAREELELAMHSAEIRFRELTHSESRLTIWEAAIDDPSRALAGGAGRADLVIVGPSDEAAGRFRSPDLGELIMTAGRPVLVVPPEVDALVPNRVLVGWTSTRESRRALVDALPLLRRAKEVLLVHVQEGHGGEASSRSLEQAAEFLRQHGAPVQTEKTARRELTIGADLISMASRRDADLLVVGGYANRRMHRWTLGSVTEILLERCHLPCLFSN